MLANLPQVYRRIFISETTQFASCNIDKRPSHAVVVANNNGDLIEDYRKIIRGANLSALAGTLLDKGVMSLEDYDDDTKKYLGTYYDDVKALTESGSASSVVASVVLQILGIFFFSLLF